MHHLLALITSITCVGAKAGTLRLKTPPVAPQPSPLFRFTPVRQDSGMAEDDRLLREVALERFTAAFGEPDRVAVTPGHLSRWALRCRGGQTLYLALDAPGLPQFAHVILTDPQEERDSLVLIVMRSPDEIDSVKRADGNRPRLPRRRRAP